MAQRILTQLYRTLSSSVKKCSEQQIHQLISTKFPQASVNVVDMSGGCGAMFEISVEAIEFKGLSLLKQHKLVADVIKDQMKDIHGVRIHTSLPKLES